MMATKVRKQIYIEAQQDRMLKRLAEETGLSEAEIIRQVIDRQAHFLQSPVHDLTAWDEERAFLTRLRQLGPVPGRRAWQREELHER